MITKRVQKSWKQTEMKTSSHLSTCLARKERQEHFLQNMSKTKENKKKLKENCNASENKGYEKTNC